MLRQLKTIVNFVSKNFECPLGFFMIFVPGGGHFHCDPYGGGGEKWYHVGSGIKADISARLPYYWSDFKDGIVGKNTIQKTVSTTLFLYFRYI